MEELIKALEKVLERGVTVEPIYVEDNRWGPMRPAYRIRLTDAKTDEVKDPSATVRGW